MAHKKKSVILIIGSSGRLGSKLKDLKFIENTELLSPTKKEFDLKNVKSMRNYLNKKNPDIIINCAAYTNVNNSKKNFTLVNKLNIIGINNLCSIIKDMDSLLIHFSTDYVFNGKSIKAYRETFKTDPISYYGLSKVYGEHIIKLNLKKFFIFRISLLYSSIENNIFYSLVKILDSDKNFKVITDNKIRPTSVNNIYKLLKMISENLKKFQNYGIYHLSDSGPSVSTFEMLKYISTISKKPIKDNIIKCKFNDYNFIEQRPQFSVFDLNKIKQNFNFNPRNWKNEFLDLSKLKSL